MQLTPARCELLYAISRQRFGDIWQGDLVSLLGCAASTASRMLRALERLGMIVRYWHDNNRKLVELTTKGRAALGAALAMIEGADGLHQIISAALTMVGDVERGVAFRLLRLLRRRFSRGRRQPVLDPYHARCARSVARVSPFPVFDGH